MFANFGGSLLVLLLLCEVFCAVFGVLCSFVTGVSTVGVLWSFIYSNSILQVLLLGPETVAMENIYW